MRINSFIYFFSFVFGLFFIFYVKGTIFITLGVISVIGSIFGYVIDFLDKNNP